ncbi:hypothetical protein JHK84_032158 [Glycine max]|nr:hypothetical protein JHK84_032158 [Glycine max]
MLQLNTVAPLQKLLRVYLIPVSKKNKKGRYQEDLEERIVSLNASLFDIQRVKAETKQLDQVEPDDLE